MDNNTGIDQLDQEARRNMGLKLEDKWYRQKIAPGRRSVNPIQYINKELGFLVRLELDLHRIKHEYISNNNDGSELPLWPDVFIAELDKQRDYLHDEKLKIWMEHLYDIKINNMFEKYKYELYTTRSYPTNRIPYSWRN